MKFRRPQSLTRPPRVLPDRAPYVALLNSTVILTTLTWTAYLVGVAYHQTLLDAVGINADLYPQQAASYFVFGFYACFATLIAVLSPMLSDMTVAGIIVLAWTILTVIAVASVILEKHRWVTGVRSKVTQSRRLRQVSFTIFFPIFGSLLTFYIPLMIAFILTVPVLVGQSAGKRDADNHIANIEKGCTALAQGNAACTEIVEEGSLVAIGIVIAASEKHIAVLEEGQSRSLIIDGKVMKKPRAKPAH